MCLVIPPKTDCTAFPPAANSRWTPVGRLDSCLSNSNTFAITNSHAPFPFTRHEYSSTRYVILSEKSDEKRMKFV